MTILRRILDKITPWHDDHEVNTRISHANGEIERSREIVRRADVVIQQYVMMDKIYKKRTAK